MRFSRRTEDLTEKDKIARMFARRMLFVITMLAAVVILVAVSMTIGVAGISATDAYKAIINSIVPDMFDIPDKTTRIIMNLRAPRVLMAVFAGASLAIGGCMTQCMLRNSLATPYTLGVSAGASFGAALAIILGVSFSTGTAGIILNAFVFSLIPVVIVIIASRFRTMTPIAMILCGVAVSYIFGSTNTLFQYFASDAAVKSVVFWTVGDLNSVSLWNLSYVVPIMTFVLLLGIFMAKRVNIMGMGDDTAKTLGVNVEFVRTSCLILACLLTATVVSFTGSIGFICLLAPQISRVFVGNDFKYLLPASALVGACLLSLADIGAKTLMAPVMLPVGAITALIGGPVFIFFLFSRKKSMESLKA